MSSEATEVPVKANIEQVEQAVQSSSIESTATATQSQSAEAVTITEIPTELILFNQYYVDLLKKLKKGCKRRRTSGSAAEVLAKIRCNYESFDKLADHLSKFKANLGPFFTDYLESEEALSDETHLAREFFSGGIALASIKRYVDKEILPQYLHAFGIIVNGADVPAALAAIKDRVQLPAVGDAVALRYLERLHKKYATSSESNKSNESNNANSSEKKTGIFAEIESTALGKLAQEIVSEVDVADIQKTMADGDIFKAFANNEGLGKLVASVGSKIQSKLSSGELNQETLIKDAMNLAMKLPSMIPGAGGGMPAGGMDGMMKMFQAMMSSGSGSQPAGRPATGHRTAHSARKLKK